MREIEDISLYPLFLGRGTLTCRGTEPTAVHAAHTHYTLNHRAYFSLWVPQNIDILYPSCLNLLEFLGKS